MYDLDQHAQINYVNNKAERGEYWRDKDPENHSHRSSVGDPGGGGAERPHPQKINKVKPIHIRTDNNTATYHQHENTNGCHVTDINQSPLCKQKVIHDKCSEEPQKSAQKETIYANHQFEKIIQKKSKGHSNPTFTGDDSHKLKALPVPENLPPIDNRTNDMYIIDESPYDRVDFNAARAKVPSPRQSNSKPVPTKRKLKNQKPIYDENAESVDV
ncbi:hypothetical protein FSP39_020048 [Pinctada imbricata]|uniref:Uncharacterized protein n=1 Tax=Pinctada imbricata TaxID=66713 RepID=A0AA88Y0X4_PINIB|nr:hypothetical protein FSP39_020048 [Pinctada imbricata]